MNYPKLAILIPIYKRKPEDMEIYALKRIAKIFCGKTIFFIAPTQLQSSWYEDNFESIPIEIFDDEYFQSLNSYNKLLLSATFYERWQLLGFDSVLICQPDVYLVSDGLEEYLNAPYDYIGAPLVRLENDTPHFYGGNGGFSLRRLDACINAIKNHADILKTWKDNEDEFFSYCGEAFESEFRVAPPGVASQFSFDRFMRVLYKINGENLPVAIHGWLTCDPKFSLQILGLDDELSSKIVDIRKIEEERCLAFVQKYQPVILYGAGLWGKVLFRYLKRKGVLVDCFAVSDDRKAEASYEGVLIKRLSEIPNESLLNGLMFSLSNRYMGEDTFYNIVENAKRRGFKHCFEFNMVLYNLAVESWIEEVNV